jgi:hypothetical protein
MVAAASDLRAGVCEDDATVSADRSVLLRLAELEAERDRWMRSATTTCLACAEARERMHAAEDRLAAERKQVSENCVMIEEYDHAMARDRVQAEQIAALQKALKRAAYVAEHLFAMIDRETWRDNGADDGQGHYEGDYHAEQVRDEIAGWKALALAEGCAAPAPEEEK